MKKIIALLLALVICLSLWACCNENDTPSATGESIALPETTTPDHTSALADILCGCKWVSEYDGSELVFNANGTYTWASDEESKEGTWSYHSHYDSSADLPLPISAVLSQNFCAYWGKVDGFTGHRDIVVGYNENGVPIMSFHGTSWVAEE